MVEMGTVEMGTDAFFLRLLAQGGKQVRKKGSVPISTLHAQIEHELFN